MLRTGIVFLKDWVMNNCRGHMSNYASWSTSGQRSKHPSALFTGARASRPLARASIQSNFQVVIWSSASHY
jgi:hypothetical protein